MLSFCELFCINLWLLSRKRKDYDKGKSQKWDIGGDSWGYSWDEPFGGARLLGMANVSLDEPELESVIFCNSSIRDDDNEDDDAVFVGSSWRLVFYFWFLIWCWMLNVVYVNSFVGCLVYLNSLFVL